MSAATTSSITILRLLLILGALGIAIYLLVRVPTLLFHNEVAAGQSQCAKDDNYFYKDPINHPYDC